ncbi:MAG: ribonuclease J [Dethiobacteria bacterium]|nr:ribonuclease J [Bacillota bacterium]NMD33692.1 ribonuclease J [Bacillota bacterium]HOB29379.1 ribonuclease J [Bacillota bacterium]HPZ42026.1 ribonuclease J [Bacillota bacterium]HQD52929.1 ribonuclease J [Bacillota bacterium]
MKKSNSSLRVIPLGGVGEIGKNMFLFEYDDDSVLLDAGLKFPEEEMHGIDIVLPDITYLLENREKLRAIILTHGHEDHIGALPYIVGDLPVPVYGTRLTLGLLKAKLEEYEQPSPVKLREIKAGQELNVSKNFRLEFFRTNHSIPDSVGVVLDTPVGIVVYTGDFKFDHTPVDGKVTDFYKLAELGRRGVLLALIDSTNADRPGFTASESEVGETIDEILRLSRRRIIFATFASNIHRIQQVITAASRHGRKICVTGRSLVNSVRIASELGYLDLPDSILVELDQINKVPLEKLVLLTTGSQGEPMSALTRIATSEHRQVEIIPGDTVIIAANPIPGNEKLVARTVDNLFRRGAEVIHQSISGVHVSGHASEEEIKLMLNFLQPRYLVPVHGEYRHMVACSRIAQRLGLAAEDIFLIEPGTVLEFTEGRGTVAGTVAAGKVMVDGLGIGDVGNVVLRDRRILAEEGIVIIVMAMEPQQGRLLSGPEIITRGFVYVRESEDLLEEARSAIARRMAALSPQQMKDWNIVKSSVRDEASTFFYEQTGRRPMIMPVIIDVPLSQPEEE